MYTAFYGLREKPFTLTPDPRFLFLASSHREALAHLLYGIEQGEGFICISGEVGTGKTTLCRTLLQRLGPGSEVAFLFNPDLSPDDLLRAICAEFGLDPSGASRRELIDRINQFLLTKKSEGRRVLLVIDEAQNLSHETLEQIRMLSNLETETSKLIQIVLLGQPELEAALQSNALRQLRQRISVHWRLTPLSSAETREYVRHRMRIAGGDERDLFSPGALREIHRRSGGTPRVVNILCERALLAGYGADAREIPARLVRQAAAELETGGGPVRRRILWRLAWPLAAGALGVVLGLLAWARWGEEGPGLRAAAAPPAASVSTQPGEEPRLSRVASRPAGELAGAPGAPVAAVAAQADEGSAAAPAPEEVSAAEVALSAEALRVASAAPAVAPPETRSPAPEASRVERVDMAELEARLAALSPAVSHARSVDAVLAGWGLEPAAQEWVAFEDGLRLLEQRGLSVLPLSRVDLATLRALDHPAIVRLPGVDGAPRSVLLGALDEREATLWGVDGSGALAVPAQALEARPGTAAYVIWHDFEGLPGMLFQGQAGTAVSWLQTVLTDLGFYHDAPSGRFDDPTRDAVRAFQRSRFLSADGFVGPRTKMALYAAQRAYAVPRLLRPEARG